MDACVQPKGRGDVASVPPRSPEPTPGALGRCQVSVLGKVSTLPGQRCDTSPGNGLIKDQAPISLHSNRSFVFPFCPLVINLVWFMSELGQDEEEVRVQKCSDKNCWVKNDCFIPILLKLLIQWLSWLSAIFPEDEMSRRRS